MATVPQTGTYLSQDNKFKIQINSANPSNGVINALYATNDSPEGPFNTSGDIGHYSWVYSEKQGKNGVAPFVIRFTAGVRPEKWPYCIDDTWTGSYQEDNTLLMDGARSYVNSKGVVQVTSLGTMKFSR